MAPASIYKRGAVIVFKIKINILRKMISYFFILFLNFINTNLKYDKTEIIRTTTGNC